MGRKNPKNVKILPIFLGGPMGPIHPLWAGMPIRDFWAAHLGMGQIWARALDEQVASGQGLNGWLKSQRD